MANKTGVTSRIKGHEIKRNPGIDGHSYKCIKCHGHAMELDAFRESVCPEDE